MTSITGRRVDDTYHIFGEEIPLVKRKATRRQWGIDIVGEGDPNELIELYDADVNSGDIPLGGMADFADMQPKQRWSALYDVGEPTGGGRGEFAPWELLEGKYSAHQWLQRRPSKVNRFLRVRFHRHERDGRLVELINHPTKLRHLVIDADKDPALKLQEVINHIGRAESEIITCSGKRGGGKACALDTPIPTPRGWTTMGALQVGDYVYGRDDAPARVTATSEVMHNHECYRVQFDDGSSIIADAGHLWLVTLPLDDTVIETTKAIAQVLKEGGTARIPARARAHVKEHDIVSIDPVPSVPVKCIVVDNKEHLFLAGKGMVPTHNSTSVGAIVDRVHNEHAREIAYLDTRPIEKLPPFAKRIVDLRAADANMIIVVDEGAAQFSNRTSMQGASLSLPVVLATARHKGLTVIAVTPSSSIMDVTFDKLSDGQIIKPTSMNQQDYARTGEGKVYREFPEMVPSLKKPEWGVFVASRIPPTSFCLPYVCGENHEHTYPCAIPRWWTKDMSQSQMQRERSPFPGHPDYDPDVVDLLMELVYWDHGLEDIKMTMQRSGSVLGMNAWAAVIMKHTNGGIHPRTGEQIRFPELGRGGGRDSDLDALPPVQQRAAKRERNAARAQTMQQLTNTAKAFKNKEG